MIKRFNFLIMLLTIVSCHKETHISNQFVEFVHTGLTTKKNRTLVVCTKKHEIILTNQEIADLERILGSSTKITEKKKEAYYHTLYNRVVTDNHTISILNEFILYHQEFFTNSTHLNNNPAAYSYNIFINGTQKFSIYYKMRDQFFREFLNFLLEKKCDKTVISEVSYL